MKIKVYVTDGICPKCKLTKRKLDDLKINYLGIVATDEDKEMLRKRGFMEFPVVCINNWEDSWSGYRVDKLNELKE